MEGNVAKTVYVEAKSLGLERSGLTVLSPLPQQRGWRRSWGWDWGSRSHRILAPILKSSPKSFSASIRVIPSGSSVISKTFPTTASPAPRSVDAAFLACFLPRFPCLLPDWPCWAGMCPCRTAGGLYCRGWPSNGYLASPCPGTKGLENWGMMESGGPEGRTVFREDSWAGAGDWAGEIMGLLSWGLCCNYIKKTDQHF